MGNTWGRQTEEAEDELDSLNEEDDDLETDTEEEDSDTDSDFSDFSDEEEEEDSALILSKHSSIFSMLKSRYGDRAKKIWSFSGTLAWVCTSTFLVMVFPVMWEYQKELQIQEYMKQQEAQHQAQQQQMALGGAAPGEGVAGQGVLGGAPLPAV